VREIETNGGIDGDKATVALDIRGDGILDLVNFQATRGFLVNEQFCVVKLKCDGRICLGEQVEYVPLKNKRRVINLRAGRQVWSLKAQQHAIGRGVPDDPIPFDDAPLISARVGIPFRVRLSEVHLLFVSTSHDNHLLEALLERESDLRKRDDEIRMLKAKNAVLQARVRRQGLP
jgi:hypothetical protein